MVLNGMTNTQILEVFEFETYEQCDEVLKVIEELKKELEKESDYGAQRSTVFAFIYSGFFNR